MTCDALGVDGLLHERAAEVGKLHDEILIETQARGLVLDGQLDGAADAGRERRRGFVVKVIVSGGGGHAKDRTSILSIEAHRGLQVPVDLRDSAALVLVAQGLGPLLSQLAERGRGMFLGEGLVLLEGAVEPELSLTAKVSSI